MGRWFNAADKRLSHVFHQEKLRAHYFNKTQKLPQERSARILNSATFPGSAERLAWRPADKQIQFTGSDSTSFQDFHWVNLANIDLEKFKVLVEPASGKVCPNRLAKRVLFLDTGDYAEALS